MPDNIKDVFVIHSKREPAEGALASRLIDALAKIGISSYEYSDWDWSQSQSKVRYTDAGGYVDPLRFALGAPQPFRRRTWESVVDKDTLTDLLEVCRVVVLIAPRGGSPSTGVYQELENLPRGATILGASWGSHNDWVWSDHRAGHIYAIRDLYDMEQKRSALDLAHLVWLHWAMDHLVREAGRNGCAVLAGAASQHADILQILRFSSLLQRAAAHDQAVEPPFDILEAGCVLRFWRGQAAFRRALPPGSPNVQKLADTVSTAVEAFCAAALEREPKLADEAAQGLRVQAAADGAMQHYQEALRFPGLSATARSEVLADRAAVAAKSSPSNALADIEEVLRLAGASGAARSQAHWLRARIHKAQRKTEPAIDDFTAALEVPEIAPIVRALCLHDRAILRQEEGDTAGALDDLEAATQIRDLPGTIAGRAHLDRAVLCEKAGDVGVALWHYAQVIDLADAPPETRLKAHMYRGFTLKERGERVRAMQDFAVVRDDPDAPPEAKSHAERQLDEMDPLRET